MHFQLSIDWKEYVSPVRIKTFQKALSSNPVLGDLFSRTPRYQHEISSEFSLTSAICADKVQDTLSNVGNRLVCIKPIGVWVIATNSLRYQRSSLKLSNSTYRTAVPQWEIVA